MSKELSLAERRTALATTAKQIDEVSAGAMEIFQQTDGGFAGEIALATAIVDLRAMLTPEVMRPIMALMNTELGFATDRDPKRAAQPVTPYDVEIVKECFIQSRILGFRTVGNEFNIIAGRCYGAKNGFVRRVRELTKGTCEASFDAPVMAADGRSAKVTCRASWEYGGKRQDMGIRDTDRCEFIIRINAGMGADGALGKAERKLYKRILERLTGRVVADGEATEKEGSIEVTSEVVSGPGAGPKFGGMHTAGNGNPAEAVEGAKDRRVHEAAAPAKATVNSDPPKKEFKPEVVREEADEAAAGLAPSAAASDAPPFNLSADPEPGSPQANLAEIMTMNTVSLDAFLGWAEKTQRIPNAGSIGSWAEVPSDIATALAKDTGALSRCVTLHKGTLKA